MNNSIKAELKAHILSYINDGVLTDDNVEEVGVSAENNGDATDDNVEGGEINNNSVRIPGFSYLEKQGHLAQTIICLLSTRALYLRGRNYQPPKSNRNTSRRTV